MSRPGAEVPVELLESDEHLARPGDRIDPEIRARAVGSHPGDLDLEGRESLVRDHEA